jgi:cytoskeletal protein CcmA (bactofilin family)
VSEYSTDLLRTPALGGVLSDSRGREEFVGTDPADWENALGPNAEFKGTLEVEDNVRLEGKFDGELLTRGTVLVVSGARVNANIQAGFAVIAGVYKGELRCEKRVSLLSSCRAQGKLITDGLAVEAGALFDGQIEMTKKSRPRQTG